MLYDYFTFALENARAQARAVSTKPVNQAPTHCCASFAHVIECNAERSIWQCPVCRCLWSVPNPGSR